MHYLIKNFCFERESVNHKFKVSNYQFPFENLHHSLDLHFILTNTKEKLPSTRTGILELQSNG